MAKINEYQGYNSKNFLFIKDIAVSVVWTGKRYEIAARWYVSPRAAGADENCSFEKFPFYITQNRIAEMEQLDSLGDPSSEEFEMEQLEDAFGDPSSEEY